MLKVAPLPTLAAEGPDTWFHAAIATERDALGAFLDTGPPSVAAIVALIAATPAPLVCTGVGKSGLVAAKLAATFSSLGTPAFCLHAGDAAHGDLGAVQPGSVVLLLSHSGTTAELAAIVPALKARGCRLVGIVGRAGSPLAQAADHLILAEIAREADPIGMAPTASTTLQMAIGDALAIAVSRSRSFARTDFLRHHPAGLLGRSMMPVRDVMRSGEALPVVAPHASVAETLPIMSAGRMGAACVVDWSGRLLGLIVDGDIRRCVQARRDLYATQALAIMQPHPQVIGGDMSVGDALELLRAGAMRFAVLPVVDDEGRLTGLVQSIDLLQSK